MFPVIIVKPLAEQKAKGFKSPNQNVQAFEHLKPVNHGREKGFLYQTILADKKIPELFF